ncbi:MAG: acyltransferase family protein [Chitinophagaceae bacterium]|nr:acyltransferase family protein [Chitinophagaceae bacterium]
MMNQTRIHGIDALRAVAMLLGVLLHATIAYRVIPEKHWVHDEQYNHWLFDFTYSFIHSFRMPLFFIIAGYFCRLLYKRVGEKEFIKRRWVRVGLPFVVGMLTIVPMGMIPYSFYTFYYKHHLPFEKALSQSIFRMPGTTGVAHLWFLYNLMMFYFVTIVLMRLKRIEFFNKAAVKFVNWWKKRSFNIVLWPLLLSIPVWLILFWEKNLFISADTHIRPKHISYIIFYGYFFGLGWLIHLRPTLFQAFVNNFLYLLLVGCTIMCLLFYVEWNELQHQSYAWFLFFKMLAAMQVVFLSLGFIGFFLRFFNLENHFWKYISDASYWVYLVHLGLVISIQIIFLNSSVPGWLRFPIALIIPIIISVVTYQWFVRYTIIGKVLHGERKRIKH